MNREGWIGGGADGAWGFSEFPAEFQAAPEVLPEVRVKNGRIPGGILGGA